jgi:hypothetical protein
MAATVANRRSGRDRRQEERRRSAADSAALPGGLERRSGTDRRRGPRRMADRADPIPEHFDYQWRNRWP